MGGGGIYIIIFAACCPPNVSCWPVSGYELDSFSTFAQSLSSVLSSAGLVSFAVSIVFASGVEFRALPVLGLRCRLLFSRPLYF